MQQTSRDSYATEDRKGFVRKLIDSGVGGIQMADVSVDTETGVVVALSLAIGSITFSGSFVAFGKLNGSLPGRPVLLPAGQVINALLAVAVGDLAPSGAVEQRLRETRGEVLTARSSAEAWGRLGMVAHAHELWDEALVASETTTCTRPLGPAVISASWCSDQLVSRIVSGGVQVRPPSTVWRT